MRAVVLAAGQGRRMGGPKALLPWDGTVLALAHVRALRDAGADEVLLVVRAGVARALEAMGAGAVLVESDAPDEWGPAGSLRAAAASFRRRDEPWVVTPVDALPVRAATLSRLREAHAALDRSHGRPRATRPSHDGRGGHPVLVDGAVLAAFLGEGVPPTLRDVLRGMGPDAAWVNVNDPTVTADLNVPEDLARWDARRDAPRTAAAPGSRR